MGILTPKKVTRPMQNYAIKLIILLAGVTLWSNASKPEEVKWVCVSRFGFMKALILIYAREVVNHVESCLADGVSVTLRFRPMIMWLGDMRLCIVYSYCTT